jgi:hypothetical protein
MQSNTALISMSPDTLHGLRNSGYTLEMFRVVNTNDDGAMPTVCFSFNQYLERTALTWTDQAKAYTSATAINVGATIAALFSIAIEPGQILTIDESGVGSVTADGIPGTICVRNTSGRSFTTGVMSSGPDAPLCAVALHGQDLKVIELTTKVLLLFSGSSAIPGTIVDRSQGPGVMVDYADEFTCVHGLERALNFDLDKGWSWDGGPWAQSVPPGADLKSLLCVRSERLATAAAAYGRRFPA